MTAFELFDAYAFQFGRSVDFLTGEIDYIFSALVVDVAGLGRSACFSAVFLSLSLSLFSERTDAKTDVNFEGVNFFSGDKAV